MAFRPLNLLLGSLLLVLLVSAPVQACFGPKLFVGAGPEIREEALFALLTLYVQEKTGVESIRVEIAKNQRPLDLITSKKVDLVFISTKEASGEVVFQLADMPLLVTGPRPLDDLQFTTVLPAIKKLNRLLEKVDVEFLVSQIKAGKSAMSVARRFLMENRWI